MSKFNKIRTNFVNRPIPKRGPFSSDEYNSGQEELSTDIATFASRWNDELYPILNSLPRGDDDERWQSFSQVPDPLLNGLDGSTLFADTDAPEVDLVEDLFWDNSLERPRTIKEALFHIDSDLATKYSELSLQVGAISNGLTTEQWRRLGERIKDGSTSSVGSLDDQVINIADQLETTDSNLSDVIDDLYDGGIPGTRLTNSVQAMLSALLTLHDGTWNTDVGLAHTNLNNWLGRTNDSETTPTYSSSDIVGTNDDVEAAVGKLDSEAGDVRTFVGKGSNTDHSYSSTNVILSTNNHEVAIGGLDTEFSHVWSFVGKGAKGSENRQFTENNYILDADSLETAIDKLDMSLLDVSDASNTEEGHIRSFIGKGSTGSENPSYSSVVYVTQNSSLESAIGELDADISAAISGVNTEAGYMRSFMGKTSAGSEMPDYSSSHNISDGTSLETAIGALDVALYTAQGNITTLQGDVISLDGRLDTAETDIITLDSRLDTAEGNIVSLDGRLDAAESNIASLDGRLDTAETDILSLETTIVLKAERQEYHFASHININEPIVWNHNMGVTFPMIQVVDKGIGDYSGVVADEVYKYEQEHGISASDSFVTTEFVNANTVHIYTNILNGVIIGVF